MINVHVELSDRNHKTGAVLETSLGLLSFPEALPTVRICYLDFHCKAELSSLLSLPYCSVTGSMNWFHEGSDAGWSSSLKSVP